MNPYIFRAYSLNQVASFISNHQFKSTSEFQLVSIGRHDSSNVYLITYTSYSELY